MRFHRIILPLLALALLPARAAETPLYFGLETADIPVVHTGEELQKLKSITADHPLRIGIECNTCQLGQGALLYIAADSHAKSIPQTHLNDWQHSVAGPVSLEVRRILAPGEREHDRDTLSELSRSTELQAIRKIKNPLYLAAVQPPSAGKYEIHILSADGNLLAKTTLTVSDKQAQPWFALQTDSINPKSRKPFKIFLTGEIARPKWPDFPTETPSGDLPRLLPDEPTSGFDISAAGNVLTVISQHPMSNNTETNFLARFWINDKPVTTIDRIEQEALAISHSVQEFKPPVKFKLAFDLAPLQAKPGDRITVQLIYSPWGVDPIQLANLERELDSAKVADDDSGQQILISNKTTFTLPPEKTPPATIKQ